MALTKKSWQDHLLASFGQDNEAARTEGDGLMIGGKYRATPGTLTDGDFGQLQLDATGNLMVNLVSGDAVTVSVGTITTGSLTNVALTHTVGTLGSVINIGKVHNAGTIAGFPTLIASYKGTIQIPTSDTVTTGTAANTLNGMGRGVTILPDNMEDTDSTKIELINSTGGAVFASGTKAESVASYVGSEFPMDTSMNWVVTAEGTQSGNRDIVYEVHYHTYY